MAGKWLSKEAVLRAIDEEPVLPGEMPEEMYKVIVTGDKDLVTAAFRIVVEQAKKGIRNRILEG